MALRFVSRNTSPLTTPNSNTPKAFCWSPGVVPAWVPSSSMSTVEPLTTPATVTKLSTNVSGSLSLPSGLVTARSLLLRRNTSKVVAVDTSARIENAPSASVTANASVPGSKALLPLRSKKTSTPARPGSVKVSSSTLPAMSSSPSASKLPSLLTSLKSRWPSKSVSSNTTPTTSANEIVPKSRPSLLLSTARGPSSASIRTWCTVPEALISSSLGVVAPRAVETPTSGGSVITST